MSQPFRKRISSIATALATIILVALPVVTAQAARNAEQVIFSGIGLPPVSSEPFGFWIWCQNEQAPRRVADTRRTAMVPFTSMRAESSPT